MSIGFAVVLPDGVLMVADGRQTHPQARTLSPIDDIDKLVPIADRVFAIPFGVVQATDIALGGLRGLNISDPIPEVYKAFADSCLRDAWKVLLTLLASDVDVNHRTMRAGFIIGGIASGSGFATIALHGTGVDQPPLLITNPLQYTALGGEDWNSHDLFAREVVRRLRGISWEPRKGPTNSYVTAILRGAVSVIRDIESKDPAIGGLIRYVVVRKGFPVHKDVVKSGDHNSN